MFFLALESFNSRKSQTEETVKQLFQFQFQRMLATKHQHSPFLGLEKVLSTHMGQVKVKY